ncbi:antigen 5 like allergen Cul n 1-like [Bactrocera neohumeralis]|uniref:antigen 5 like allergen Cul n 1-like n=1 Tax=Bactrocera tryoni TaxID=59916 RepID=UPI001A99FE18|nr:antigen 5 like allergen Cul n 1-like [Bactrocera tryoni]XP_050329021.1 antigen 5 like allergen Cul n 1-like [Bactrocera neohumeralis]
MELRLVFVVISLTALQFAEAVNYCNTSLCGAKKHIACNNNGKFAASCRNAAMVTLTQANKNLIVKLHNTKRNTVASGKTKLKAACRMGTMQWNDELAALAALNVKQCQMKHDACHNTQAFKHSGQNLAWSSYYGTPNVPQLLQKLINLWYNEIKYTTQAYINKYPNNYSGPAIGHFTVMVGQANIRVGCAVSTYSVTGQSYKAFLLACNYATTNMIGAAMYTTCAKAASGCKKGTNTAFPSLCAKTEVY